MGHGKESPRQKMIGLMYLFLTCMLALNVSKSILDAFININTSLGQTNANFISKNEIVYNAIDKAHQNNPAKAQAAFDYSKELRLRSDSLVLLMQDCKENIIVTADKIDTAKLFYTETDKVRHWIEDEDNDNDTVLLENHVKSKDNSDYPAQIMVGQEGNPGRATLELKPAVNRYRDWCLGVVSNFDIDTSSETKSGLVKQIRKSFDTEDKPGHGHESGMLSWEYTNFEHLPLIAVVTILTQMQAEVRNVEGDLLNMMYGSLDAASFKFNKLEPIVLTTSTYVMKGNEYSAQIFLAAFDTTQAPIVQIGKVQRNDKGELYIDNPIEVTADSLTNMATYKTKGVSVGDKKYEGLIKIPKPGSEGLFMSYKFESEYQVAEPSLVVSPTKMNVFYIGPENPVQISVPGVPADKISASISPASKGAITKKGNEYVVIVKQLGTCQVNVTAEINGKKQNMGSVEFRIKRVPDPVAMVLKQEGGDITKSRLGAARSVDAVLKDFDFELKFRVTKFTVSAKIGAYFVEERSTSDKITQQIKQNILTKVTKGTKVYFEDIEAKGPGGRARKLGVLMFKIK